MKRACQCFPGMDLAVGKAEDAEGGGIWYRVQVSEGGDQKRGAFGGRAEVLFVYARV